MLATSRKPYNAWEMSLIGTKRECGHVRSFAIVPSYTLGRETGKCRKRG